MRASKLIFDYVCSRCWGQLIERETPGGMVVSCASDAHHEGFVTREYVEFKRERSEYDLMNVVSLYQDTPFASLLGLRSMSRVISREQFERNKRILGRDPGGID